MFNIHRYISTIKIDKFDFLNIAIILACLTLANLPFLLWSYAYITSDDAIIGIAANNMITLKEVPKFFYGQDYLLLLEAYFAVPFLLTISDGALALKALMFFIQSLIGLSMYVSLRLDHTNKPQSLFASLLLVMPGVVVTHRFSESMGGNPEPILYSILLWTFRRHLGLIAGLGLGLAFLQREFILYAIFSLLLVELLANGVARFRWRQWFSLATGFALIFWFIKGFNKKGALNVTDYAQFFDLGRQYSDLSKTLTNMTPLLFNFSTMRLDHMGLQHSIAATTAIGQNLSLLVLICFCMVSFVAVLKMNPLQALRSESMADQRFKFALYLLTIACLSPIAMAISDHNPNDKMLIRYCLMMYFALPSLYLLSTYWKFRYAQMIMGTLAAIWCFNVSFDYIRHIRAHMDAPPSNDMGPLTQLLTERGYTHGYAPYWTSYRLVFLSQFKLKVASTEMIRIRSLREEVAAQEPRVFHLYNDRKKVACQDPIRINKLFLCFGDHLE